MSSYILNLQFPSDTSSLELSVLAGLNTDAGEDSQCCAWWADELITRLSDEAVAYLEGAY